MQKKIIALAVAGLVSGAAFAQSNVTIYGVVDAYAVSGKGNAATGGTSDKFNGINGGGLSGSRLGFKGTEDMGGGLKAVYTLEFGTLDNTANATTNSAASATAAAQSTNTNGMDGWRQAYVGVSGGFGTAVMGRLQHAGYDFMVKYDALVASIFSPVGQLQDNWGTAMSARDALGRADNAVAYISPNMGGVTVKAAYAFGEQVKGKPQINAAGTTSATDVAAAQNAWILGADYDAGPMSVGLVYGDLNNIGGTFVGGTDTDRKEWALGAKYNFGMVTPTFTYQRAKNTLSTGVWDKTNIINLGAIINVSATGAVKVAYARLKSDNSVGTTGLKANSWGVDYEHAMSKRTTAYVGYSKISNDSGYGYSLLNLKGSAAGTTISTGLDQTSSQVAAGIRHTF